MLMLQALRDGESYELCLTTTLAGSTTRQPWACYQTLRELNPAPYGAWLAFGDCGLQVTSFGHASHACVLAVCASLTFPAACSCAVWVLMPEPAAAQVCCSSPERFLCGGRGRTLEARPIKVHSPPSARTHLPKRAPTRFERGTLLLAGRITGHLTPRHAGHGARVRPMQKRMRLWRQPWWHPRRIAPRT